MAESSFPWFAIRVKSQCEKMVSGALRYKGYEEFLPLYSSRRCWSDRTKVLQLPVFAGYLFCQFEMSQRMDILKTPGVCNIVGQGSLPHPVDPKELDNIRVSLRSGRRIEPWKGLAIGDRVRIDRGPLRGIEGQLLRVKGTTHLILGIELLQRSVAVEIDEAWVSAGKDIPLPTILSSKEPGPSSGISIP